MRQETIETALSAPHLETLTMAWQDKVKEAIAAQSQKAWRAANPKSNGHGKQKPYCVPELACAMVRALNDDDEAEGKLLLLIYRTGALSLI